ncbi:MAG TPA: PDZ domain-containing protein [Gemmatimonadaceae bacterium]|jgi:hypothetical protein|nr:PDZ domain-containing protein [Gemmatimonadaceae bacterium]
MRLIISVLTGALTLGLAPALEAQKTPKKETAPKLAPTEKDGCITRDGRTECVFRRTDLDSSLMKRPVIGVELSPTGTLRDTIGVFVSRVTPKGPAEKAGVIEGDRIVSINGIDLRVNAADAEDGYAADLPRRRLTREVGKLTPGNVANLRVWSGGRVRDVAVTIGRASDFREAGSFGYFDGMPGGAMRLMPGMMDGMRMQLREFPKLRMEQMRVPRMRWEQMELPRMEMQLRKLDDGGYIFEKSKKSREEAEKKEKSKK